ncbi:MAG: RraA family protein [Firmicutes bacterium]|nr:RraA family protein [Bacillota bacterium]
MAHYEGREEIATRFRRLYTPVVCDILDSLGYRNQFLRYDIRPLDPSHAIYGWAYTMQAVVSDERPALPYQKQFEGTDRLEPGDVLVVGGAGTSTAFWGELFSTRARIRGAVGAVIDGLCRDTSKVIAMGFPVFSRGRIPADSYGRLIVTAYGNPVECGGVVVSPGDFVMGDADGVVIVPRALISTVLEKAEFKAHTEDQVREALMRGESVESVYQRYGVM